MLAVVFAESCTGEVGYGGLALEDSVEVEMPGTAFRVTIVAVVRLLSG